MTTTKKKHYRIEGVNHSKNLSTYAKNVEKTLNALLEDGYTPNMVEQKNGVLIIATLNDESPPRTHPLQSLLDRISGGGAPDGRRGLAGSEKLNDRSKALYARFLSGVASRTAPEATLYAEAAQRAVEHTKGFTQDELIVAATQFEEMAETHVKDATNESGTHPSDCILPVLARTFAAVVRESARLSLQ